MVRTTNADIAKAESGGIIQGIQNQGRAFETMPQAMNQYFAMKTLENQTALAQADILKKKAETDRTNQQFQLTGQQWDDLIAGPMFQNLRSANLMEATDAQRFLTDAQRKILPTQQMAWERYAAETAKTNASAKHVLELYELAKKEGLLKQGDIDMLEKLTPHGSKAEWGVAEAMLNAILRKYLKP